MKKSLNTLFPKIKPAVLANLTTVVKEKLAKDVSEPGPNIFTAARLWNIQRHGKRILQRRFIF